MRYVKVKCVNENCAFNGVESTVAAGRPVAPNVTELLGTLECDMCGHQVSVEKS